MDYLQLHSDFIEKRLFGKYITLDDLTPLLSKLEAKMQLQIIGESVLGKPLYSCQLGTGKIKILIWSQMHGNESTTTKALFDFINLLNSSTEIAKLLLKKFTFCCIPMLNPDGSFLYTRENANKVDINRDSNQLTQPESKALRATFDTFNPNYCFNLHDQRTIFGVDNTNKPATVSFLAPSFNQEREFNETRIKAVNVIVAMNDVLQEFIPSQISRFDDSFNINCIGDQFQSLNVPTILFEAGHFPGDYNREITRKYLFIALLSSFEFLSLDKHDNSKIENYLNIPQNKVFFYDFVYKNIKINYDNCEIITNFAVQYKEELIDNQLLFNAYIVEIGVLKGILGHFEFDAQGECYVDENENIPKIDQKANFYLGKNIKIVNGLIKM